MTWGTARFVHPVDTPVLEPAYFSSYTHVRPLNHPVLEHLVVREALKNWDYSAAITKSKELPHLVRRVLVQGYVRPGFLRILHQPLPFLAE
jgi:hypothetical protein